MDNCELKNILQLLNSLRFNDIDIEYKNFRIRVKENLPGPTISSPSIKLPEDTVIASSFDNPEEIDICSPLVGTYYDRPSPDSDSFVKKGDRVKKGDVLCMIESMKIFNEILADQEGIITAILAENGQMVEYDACLMKISKG